MPEENLAIVRRALDETNAFMRGELSEGSFTTIDPEFEHYWHGERTMPDTPQRLRGAAEMFAFGKELRSAWTDLTFEPLEWIEAPDGRVLTLIRQSGRGRESRAPIVVHAFQLWTIRDGKVLKIELFRHRAEALEAAGLSE